MRSLTDKKKADLILERLDTYTAAMDDMSAAVDAVNMRITTVLDWFVRLDNRLTTLHDKIDIMEQQMMNLNTNVGEITSNTSTLSDDIAALTKSVTETDEALYAVKELAGEARRRERQEMLFDARAAMGRVAFVRMK